jgi:hypothetical protein
LRDGDGVRALAELVAGEPELGRRFFLTEEPVSVEQTVRYFGDCYWALMVHSRPTQEVAGGVLVTALNPHSRQCFLSVLALERFRGLLFFEGIILGIDAIFQHLHVQRIRFDVIEYNLEQFASVSSWPGVDSEGVRLDWLFQEGRYWDAHLFSISQAGWLLKGSTLAERLRAAGRRCG